MIKTEFELFLAHLEFRELLYLYKFFEGGKVEYVAKNLKYKKATVSEIKTSIKMKAERFYNEK